MRIWSNGRGRHPAVEGVLPIHQWTLDEASGSAIDLIGNADPLGNGATTVPDPFTVSASTLATLAQGPSIGRAGREFNGTSQAFLGAVSGADAGNFSGGDAGSIILSFRFTSSGTGERPLIAYGVLGGADTANNNYLLHLALDASNQLILRWEYGAGIDQSYIFTKAGRLLPDRWHRLALVWDVDRWHLYLQGGLVETHVPANPPDTGVSPAQNWMLGVSEASGTNRLFRGAMDSVTVYGRALSHTQVEDAFRQMALLDMDSVVHWRVDVELQDGSWQDMSSLYGHDWLADVPSIQADVDESVETVRLRFHQQMGELSLALLHDNLLNRLPLLNGSTVVGPDNQTHNAFGQSASTEILTPTRGVRVYCCRLPIGQTPVATDWQLRFEGYLDAPQWGDEVVEVTAHDVSIRLTHAWILAAKQQFGNTASPILVEAVIQDILDYLAAETVDGVAMLNPAITLQVEGTPSWTLETYTQERQSGMEAVRKLAAQMGWLVRTKFNHATGRYVLTLCEPDRVRKYPDLVLTADDFRAVPSAAFGLDSVRTYVRLTYRTQESTGVSVPTIASGTSTAAVGSRAYYDANGILRTDGSGTVTPEPYLAVFTAHTHHFHSSELGYSALDLFGPRPMELGEDETKGIKSVDEAQAMAVGLLRDLCLPKADTDVEARPLPELEVNDFIRRRLDRVSSTDDQDGAVMTLDHSEDSTLQLRGLPAGGVVSHLAGEAGRQGGPPAPVVDPSDNDNVLSDRLWTALVDRMARTNILPAMRGAQIGNTDFRRRVTGGPPDGWFVTAGTWGTDASLDAANAERGPWTLRIEGHLSNPFQMVSTPAPCASGDTLECRLRGKGTTATDPYVQARVEWLDDDYVSLSYSTVHNDKVDPTVWTEYRTAVLAPTSARFYRLVLNRNNSNAEDCLISLFETTLRQPQARVGLTNDISTGFTAKVWKDLAVDFVDAPNCNNVGGHFDTGTSAFTCPSSGFYAVNVRVTVAYAADTLTQLRLMVGGVEVMRSPAYSTRDDDGNVVVELNAELWVTQGQTVKAQLFLDAVTSYTIVGGTTGQAATSTFFSIRRVTPD